MPHCYPWHPGLGRPILGTGDSIHASAPSKAFLFGSPGQPRRISVSECGGYGVGWFAG